MDKFSLSGKTILVTGASSGIGRAIAIACSQQGARVILNGRNQLRLQATIEALSEEGHEAVQADLTEAEQRTFLVESLPQLDGVVHCAGIGSRVLCKMLEEQDVQLDVTPQAVEFIAEEGYDPTFGARPVKRAIQKLLLNELSKKLLSGHINREKPIIVDCFGDNLVFRN